MTDPPSRNQPSQALILAAHGSHRHPRSSRPAIQHAARIRDRGPFDEVRAAFWKEEPSLREVSRTLTADRVFVVPLLTSDGYFARTVFPRELRSSADHHDLHLTDPVGTHPAMTGVILDRIESVTGDAARASTLGVAVVGHGTTRHETSDRSTRDHAAAIRATDRFAEVRALFLDQVPYLAELTDHFEVDSVVAVPLFIADGYHASEDLPAVLGISAPGDGAVPVPAETDGTRVWLAPAVGTDPRLADVIVERAIEAGASADRTGRSGWPAAPSTRSDRIAAFVSAAPDGIDFDGLETAAAADGTTVRIPDRVWTDVADRDLEAIAETAFAFVANWHHWTRSVSATGDRWRFLRWIDRADSWEPARRLTALRTGIRREWGELVVTARSTADGGRRYDLRHRRDRDVDRGDLEALDEPDRAHAIARYDESGRFRPLTGARSLRSGWVLPGLDGSGLLRSIEAVYPASIANWDRAREESLDVCHFAETAARQTGRYAGVADLSGSDLARSVETVCGTCVRRREWEESADTPLRVDRGDGVIPCREPCSFFIEAGRAALRDEPPEPPFDRGPFAIDAAGGGGTSTDAERTRSIEPDGPGSVP